MLNYIGNHSYEKSATERRNKLNMRIICYFAMYFLFLFSSGFHFMNSNGTLALSMLMISSGVLSFCSRGYIGFDRTAIKRHFFVLMVCFFSGIIARDSIKSTLIFLIGYFVAVFISMNVSLFDYGKIYTTVMRSLMLVSLVFCIYGWVTHQNYWIFPFPNISREGRALYAFFSILRDYGSQTRNASIFWEPGSYQTFLIFEFVFETFLRRRNFQLYRYITIISLVSTMSTMGIVAALFCFGYLMFFDPDRKNVRSRRRMVLICLAVVIVLGLFWYVNRDYFHYLIVRNITSKIKDFVSYNINNPSSTARRDSIRYPVLMFLKSPFLGVGESGYSWMVDMTGHTMSVCTPLNWFAKYGIIYGLFMVIGMYRTISYMYVKKMDRALMFGLLIFSIFSENYDNNPLVILMCVYGYTRRNVSAVDQKQGV